MVKKGSWFSAIKRVFTPNETEKKGSKEIKNGRSGKLKHGESKSFIPHFFFFFREPSSIERILEEADEEEKKKLFVQPHPPRIASFRLPYQHHQSATKIQSAYRAYVARRRFRELRGLMRFQRMIKGHNVKKQTINTMKMMQLLVRVQTQIQSLRMVPKEEEESKKVNQTVIRAMDRYPWWWNWLELLRQLPPDHGSSMKKKNNNNMGNGFNNLFLLTLTQPSSTNSGFPTRRRSIKPRGGGNEADDYAFDLKLLKDDDNYSLTSCPRPFSVPNYMTSTISAKAKLRSRDPFLSPRMTPINNHSKRRPSFPYSNSMNLLDQHMPTLLHSMGNTSIDSTISMPAVLLAGTGRRKPFNRFV